MLRRDEKGKGADLEEVGTFLGEGTAFKGVITYDGTVRIDGKVEGEIITEGTLIVGETAVVEAEISVGSLMSSGKIMGNVRAREKIHLLGRAVLDGTITTPVLMVEEGAHFNGKCEMGRVGNASPAPLETIRRE